MYHYLFTPEAGSNIFKVTLFILAVHPLIGRRLLQRTKVLDEGTDLDIVEVGLIDSRGDDCLATIPCHLELWVLLVDILRQTVDALRVVVATHEGDAGDVTPILRHEGVYGSGIQWQANILPQVMAMAPRTTTRAIRDVNCQCRLVGNLLKNNTRIYILQHIVSGHLILWSVESAGGLFLTWL